MMYGGQFEITVDSVTYWKLFGNPIFGCDPRVNVR